MNTASDGRAGQKETKAGNLQKLLDEMRDRVTALRDEQDELAMQKAEAAIVYAVSRVEHSPGFLNVLILVPGYR